MKQTDTIFAWLFFKGWSLRKIPGSDLVPDKYEYRSPEGESGSEYQVELLHTIPEPVAEWIRANQILTP